MTGALAGIVGLDALSLTGEELELTDAERAAGMSCADKLERIAAEASNEGAILTLSMHIPNLARAAKRPQADGGFDFYDDDDDTPAFMERLEHAAALAASAAGSRSRAMTIRIGRVRRQPSRGVIISRIS